MPYVAPPNGAPRLQPGQTPSSGTPAAAGSATYAAEKVGPAVVGIVNKAVAYDMFLRPYTQQKSGSGVIFHQEGYIVTNNHVVEGARELLVTLSDGRVLTGQVVGTDPFTDLAVIQVKASGLPVAEFGDSNALRVGELAVAIGNPVSTEFARTVTAGVISGLNRRVQQGERFFVLIQTDAAINPGNSGGPLVNGGGQVIGINTIKFAAEEIEGMGFAIPVNDVRPIVNELLLHGRIVRPWLGVSIANKEDAARYGVEIERGVLVVEIVRGGPAADAGLRAGDTIISVDGHGISSAAELMAVVQAHKVGDRVAVVVVRRGTQLSYAVVLGEMRVE
jgi:serine protease Do